MIGRVERIENTAQIPADVRALLGPTRSIHHSGSTQQQAERLIEALRNTLTLDRLRPASSKNLTVAVSSISSVFQSAAHLDVFGFGRKARALCEFEQQNGEIYIVIAPADNAGDGLVAGRALL